MNRRERLMATLRGETVDRPAVNFYEVGGYAIDPGSLDPFHIYGSASWRALLQLAEEQTDLIRMRAASQSVRYPEARSEFFKCRNYETGDSRFTETKIQIGDRQLKSITRRDLDVDTIWTLEHLLKDTDDLRAYLTLPDELFELDVDASPLYADDLEVGDKGIVMVNTGDPLCIAADLFSMENYTIIALTEPELFHPLLEKLSKSVYEVTAKVSKDFPGYLWRICGPEYATEPYLPPRLFEEYVVRYTKPMVQMIQQHGGYARLHCHGRLRNVLPYIMEMGADALDPIEPPHQGDVELKYVRENYGKDMALFGNIEASNIENIDCSEFEKVVARSIKEGTAGEGRGFVLMPSAAPYGREITSKTMTNYETMIRLVTQGS